MMNNKVLSLAAALLAFSLPARTAENLIFNSGFELGNAGCYLQKILQPDTNPQLLYEGPVSDSSAFVSGGKSLRIPNRFAEKCTLYFKEFKLKPGTKYTFSASMKSSVPNLKVGVSIISATSDTKYGWDTIGGNFEIGKEWSRQTFSFKTQSPWPNEWYTLRIGIGAAVNASAGDLWLDDVQLSEGAPCAYKSAAELEAAALTERQFYITSGQGGEPKAFLRVCNNGKQRTDAKLQVSVIEDVNNIKVFSKDFEVSLDPGETKEISFEPPFRFGVFRLETASIAEGKSFATAPSFVGIAGKYDRKPIDINKDFCVGLNLDNPGYYQAGDCGGMYKKPGFRCDLAVDGGDIQLLADMGCRLIRDWATGKEIFRWCNIEPEEGKFDFRKIDRILEIYKTRGIVLMPVLGHTDFMVFNQKLDITKTPKWPAWLMPKCVKVEKSGDWKVTAYLPPMELWRRYIKNVVEHCKGQIEFYEITNEPNGWLAPETYVEYLKAANEEIKKADPSAKTIGFCSTGDLGGNMEGFLGTCYKLGGLKYADIVSFHPYDAPTLAFRKPADQQLDEAKRLIKQYGDGRDIPLWNTEIYYLRETFFGNNGINGVDVVESEKHAPYHVAWRFLTDQGEGVAQECFLIGDPIFKSSYSPHFDTGGMSLRSISGDFVVFNALARHFEGAKPVSKIRWGCDTICYIYERNGKQLAAFWTYGDMKDLKVKLNTDGSAIQAFDLYGNKLPFPENGVFKLEHSPLYLETKEASRGRDAKSFTDMLKNGVAAAKYPVKVGTVSRLVPRNGGWALVISFRNCSGRELSGKLGVQGDALVGLEGVNFNLPADGEISLPVQVKLKDAPMGKVVAKFAVDNKLWELPLTVAPQGKVLLLEERTQAGPASIKASSDGKTLKLSFDVKDSTPSGFTAGRAPWEQDCVELFIDTDPIRGDMKHPDAYNDNIARLFILPYAPERQRLVIWPCKLDLSAARVLVSKKADGYTAALELPLAAFSGNCIGFEAQFDDADTVKRLKSTNWNSGGDAFKNRFSFGFIQLR